METQKKLHLDFVKQLTEFIGEPIHAACNGGRYSGKDFFLAYKGILLDVSPKVIVIEKDPTKEIAIIPLKFIHEVCLQENQDTLSPFDFSAQSASKRYKCYQRYLNKFVQVAAKKHFWSSEGQLKFIGNNYFAIYDEKDKTLGYVNAPKRRLFIFPAFQLTALR